MHSDVALQCTAEGAAAALQRADAAHTWRTAQPRPGEVLIRKPDSYPDPILTLTLTPILRGAPTCRNLVDGGLLPMSTIDHERHLSKRDCTAAPWRLSLAGIAQALWCDARLMSST